MASICTAKEAAADRQTDIMCPLTWPKKVEEERQIECLLGCAYSDTRYPIEGRIVAMLSVNHSFSLFTDLNNYKIY